MTTFTSTLDLPNLSGFDKGIPITSTTSKYQLLKWFLIVCFVVSVIYYFFLMLSKDKKEEDISKKMKLIK